MKKVLFTAALFGALLFYSCKDSFKDNYGGIDEDEMPSWLGGSIYAELQSGQKLTGQFTYYLRLIDDLGYKETLNRTGSKTIFPANDEAFERFFADNNWGISSYDELTYAQKNVLLKSSMLDNALLTGMFSNVQATSTSVDQGLALKHASNLSVIDSITLITPEDMPLNNTYWDKFREDGTSIWAVSDNTTPPLVHFTREQMLNNGITLSGDDSDFAIITGEPYDEDEKPVYIYDNKIINKDITCLNGYIHQVKNVLVQPGNMAQIIGREKDTKYFSHILDYFKAAYPDAATTNQYNSWVKQNPDLAARNGYTEHDVYQVRYLSSLSQGARIADPNGNYPSEILNYDPGWNEYYPNSDKSTEDRSKLTDMGTMFVPTDDALWKYFSGPGAFIIKEYGKKPNTRENLLENLDSVHNANPVILTSFINNIQKTSFVSSTPSKFPEIINDASELLNMSVDSLILLPSGRYDIKIANNGVIYKTCGVLAPDRYRSVLGPVCTYRNMKIMDWAVEEKAKNRGFELGIDFQYYLLAMKATYAFFIPTDEAFGADDAYYLDPASINWTTNKAKLLHFRYDADDKTLRNQQFLTARAYDYNLSNGQIEIPASVSELNFTSNWVQLKSALGDIMNYHTIVLDDRNETVTSGNKYYKTKHGAEVLVEQNGGKMTVKSGSQIDGSLPAASVVFAEKEENGVAYHMDHLVQPTIYSVTQVLKQHPELHAFYDYCESFSNPDLMAWLGYSEDWNNDPFKMSDQDRKLIFSVDYTYHTAPNLSLAPEGNVKFFNTYNYTLYAPNADAMQAAYADGLPKWEDIDAIYQAVRAEHPEAEQCPEPYRTYLRKQVERMREFCAYHFQYISLYADDHITKADGGGGKYQSLFAENGQPPKEYNVTCSGGVLTVRDGAGKTHTINANDKSQLSNLMARDYWLDKTRGTANNGIKTSSFCVIHELKEPLHFEKAYNDGLTTCTAAQINGALAKKRASMK